ncbi:MAG: heme ABC transporter ATP-binding protein [Microbacteriaceae bacterium]
MSGKFFSKMLALPEKLEPGQLALSLRDISLSYGERKILNNVSLQLYAGEILALVGPNGAGKSSLLDVLSGDILAEGSVEIQGKELRERSTLELARHRAVLTQHNELSFPFTVIEVVEMGRSPWQRTQYEADDEEAIRDSLKRTETEQFSERQYPSLSGGEKARASLARVLAQRTGILLLDEPTAALDIKHQEAVLQLARDRANAGDAVVVVLHDLNLAAAFADRVALLSQGVLVGVGSPDAVFSAETISETYQSPVEVIQHPRTGRAIVLPIRRE